MCKLGDIILVNSYKDGNNTLSRHSFVVISDEQGEIQGLPYDFICNVMSSFKDDTQRARKLKYHGNFEISSDDTNIENGNTKDGYIKSEQFYYFKKSNLDYQQIGTMTIECFNKLVEFIKELNEDEFKNIIDNL